MVRPAWAIGCRGSLGRRRIRMLLSRSSSVVRVQFRAGPAGSLLYTAVPGGIDRRRQFGRLGVRLAASRPPAAGDTIARGTPPRTCRGEWRPRAAGRLTRRARFGSGSGPDSRAGGKVMAEGVSSEFQGLPELVLTEAGMVVIRRETTEGGLGFRRVEGASGWPAGFGERWPGAGWS